MTIQHDAHLAPWLAATFNLTVEYVGHDGRRPHFNCWEGDYDLDAHTASDSTVFGAALEWASCYRGMLLDELAAIELGERPAIEQLNELLRV